MKMVKSLTKANAAKYGIDVREDLNFSDDGNRFRGFSYKGMPMTQCVSRGECYLSIRVDYLENNFTYKEWMQTKEYALCDEFNGVNEFDIEKLIENLEKVIAKVNEINSNCKVDETEIKQGIEIVKEEIFEIEEAIFEAAHASWWRISEYKLKRAADYMRSLERKANEGYKLIEGIENESIRNKKRFIEKVRNVKNYKILGGEFYMSELKKLLDL